MTQPPPERIFAHVYTEPHHQLVEQEREFLAYLDSFAGLTPTANRQARRLHAARAVAMTGTPTTLAKALNIGLRSAMEDDPKVLVMGEDVGRLGGVFRVTDGLQKDFGEHRVLDTPLAESGIVGTAVGLAMRGYRPVAEIQFDGFVFPGVRPDRLAGREDHLPLAGRLVDADGRSGFRSAAASARSSTTPRRPSRSSATSADCGWSPARTRRTPTT